VRKLVRHPAERGDGEALTVSGNSIGMAAASSINTAQDWAAESESTVGAAVMRGHGRHLVGCDQYTYGEGTGYVDLINMGYQVGYGYEVSTGPSTSTAGQFANPYAEPFVLTVNSTTGSVGLAELKEIGGNVSTGQLWADDLSPAQDALRKAAAEKSG
jgi:hypothetical protein